MPSCPYLALLFLACCSIVQAAPRSALCWDELAPFSIDSSDPLWPNMSRINNPAFNGNSSSSQPAFVVLPDSDAQVQLALACAVRNQLRVAVKAGGHSFAGYSTVPAPGFMINLRRMNRVIWANDTVVKVQAGATWAGNAWLLASARYRVSHVSSRSVFCVQSAWRALGGHGWFVPFGGSRRLHARRRRRSHRSAIWLGCRQFDRSNCCFGQCVAYCARRLRQ